MTKFNTCVLIIILSLTTKVNAQGCSDAGVCTVNSLKPHANMHDSIQPNNQFKIGLNFGKADYNIFIVGNYLEYNRKINKNFSADAKITTLAQNGNNISVFGLGDLYLNVNKKIYTNTNLILGAKIPLTNANALNKNRALPMDYQSSLGTFDLIFGLGYSINKLQLVVALQQPLVQNRNKFIPENFSESKLSTFQNTNNYVRSGDIILRASYPVLVNKKINITAGLLPIYHLQNDKFTNASNNIEEIKGSKGLTLNGNIFMDYFVNSKSKIQLNMGSPFVTRDNRPDGLTRSFVFNIEYGFIF